ncbi:cory-CC-star protein [Psychrobacter sp. APC 3426]|nr:cory-CC-star protein [Psychrobacter sp. APC 3426]MDN3399327.1 cory-CC-star protein [Psychrobacter sp. APC 3426]
MEDNKIPNKSKNAIGSDAAAYLADDKESILSDTNKPQTWWQRFAAGLNEFYHAPYRQTMARAARDEEDFFMLLMFAESLGIDNPASFYTLELQPLFLENFHEWHTRMGMDRCPFDHVGCC